MEKDRFSSSRSVISCVDIDKLFVAGFCLQAPKSSALTTQTSIWYIQNLVVVLVINLSLNVGFIFNAFLKWINLHRMAKWRRMRNAHLGEFVRLAPPMLCYFVFIFCKFVREECETTKRHGNEWNSRASTIILSALKSTQRTRTECHRESQQQCGKIFARNELWIQLDRRADEIRGFYCNSHAKQGGKPNINYTIFRAIEWQKL